MQHVQFKQERRRFANTEPRAQIAIATIGRTKLVMRDGYAHVALVALGFEPIMECEPDAVLLRAPEGYEECLA